MKNILKILPLFILCTLLSISLNAQKVKEVNWHFKIVNVVFTEDPDIKIDWLKPKEKEITVNGEEIEVELQIFSPNPKEEFIFTIVINDDKGMKADEAKLFGDNNSFTYTNKVQLPFNVNELKLQIADKQGKVLRQSESRRVLKGDNSSLDKIWVYWINPNPNKLENKPYVQRESELFVDFNINSNQKLDKGKLSLHVNNKIFQPSSRAKLTESGAGNYNFNDYVKLDEKAEINEIFLKIQTVSGEAKTGTLPVRYDPIRPNLHIIAIGVPFPNLLYTTNDARDIIDIYKDQGGKEGNRIFNSVEVESVIGEEATAKKIADVITHLKATFINGNIGENDVILIFISSHGSLNKKEELIIQGKDYDPENPDFTGVKYEDIISWLNLIPCKKLVLIDACHSGGGKANTRDVNNHIISLNRASGVSVITSSRDSQQSWEDDIWKNGAFTEAIVKGLKNGAADSVPKDGIITVEELYDYMSKAVPDMVEKTKNKNNSIERKITQNPVLVSNGLGNVAIYITNK